MEGIELGVTVFKFEFPSSVDEFVEKVNTWATSTEEGKRYHTTDNDEDTILKLQRGKGVLTGPIVFEFRIGSAIGPSIDILVRGYVRMFGLSRYKQDLRSDAMLGGLPRRNGWKDMLKLLDYVRVSNYEYIFQ